jgi:hypothetical protein
LSAGANLVLRNFVYRVESITPTYSDVREFFVHNARSTTLDPDASPGMVRSFGVFMETSEEAHDVEDITERWAVHTFTVEINYPVKSERGDMELQAMIGQDRHDLMKVLRTSDYKDGISTSAPATVTGLQYRKFVGDELDREDPITWVYTQTWECMIQETE